MDDDPVFKSKDEEVDWDTLISRFRDNDFLERLHRADAGNE
eukprot:CAMPEP_0177742056 /NCGR_PEP_ID=MMETSP0484_2-20121128/28446_1 /TAXON_ID=354590 /ORGANISM="Rhodomonas lens, Strain RHODO" /LENGTH=40 /DNA_ID= /DNA_START= /DNA_END= /DNA_ORIENTATION=